MHDAEVFGEDIAQAIAPYWTLDKVRDDTDS